MTPVARTLCAASGGVLGALLDFAGGLGRDCEIMPLSCLDSADAEDAFLAEEDA